MRKPRVLKQILKNTHTDQILGAYLAFVLLSALVIWIFEPQIHSYIDALWYCYAVASTAGFGDIVVTALLPKIISVAVTIYSVIVIGLITGVIVNYYTEIINRKNKETMEAFMDKLERLPELSDEELTEISDRVRDFREGRKASPIINKEK